MLNATEPHKHGTLTKTPQPGEIAWKEKIIKYKQRCRVCGARLEKTPRYDEIEPYARCSDKGCGVICWRKLTEEE